MRTSVFNLAISRRTAELKRENTAYKLFGDQKLTHYDKL